MIKCNVVGYVANCNSAVGGVGNLYVADANDFEFTSGAADTDGSASGYASVARRTGATTAGGAYFYEIKSVIDSLSVDVAQSNTERTSSEYAYEIKAKVPTLSQKMTNFAKKMDAASVCCDLLFVWIGFNGEIMVAGEKFVDGSEIPPFRFYQDGSKFTTGVKFSAFNGGELSFKSAYLRLPYEYTGARSTIAAFVAP